MHIPYILTSHYKSNQSLFLLIGYVVMLIDVVVIKT